MQSLEIKMTKSLLFTREKSIDSAIKALISANGGRWQHLPLISLRLMEQIPALPQALSEYDWVFFTSSAAVRFFYDYYESLPEECSLAVIGSQTFSALRKVDQLRAEYPSYFTSEVFVEHWLSKQSCPQRVLFPQSDLSRKIIQERLRLAGHFVDDFVLYRNDFIVEQQLALKAWLNLEEVGTTVIFASPSAWQNFYSLYQRRPFALQFASIGPVTTKAIERTGFSVSYEARECTMLSLVEEILARS